MSIGNDSQSSSQILYSSHSSLNQPKKASPEISKTYKHASQLFLTRRLVEAYEALQPVVGALEDVSGHHSSDDEPPAVAPIATATTSQRIKIWSLYVTLLNAIIDLGSEEGGRDFGPKGYRQIVAMVRDGSVWEFVVQNGYSGREGSVDAEVVYNLSILLLGQASDQTLNQSRLETYFASTSSPSLDISNHLNKSPSRRPHSHINGTDTPRDLTSRLKILELFTLHVLPRNEEWDYARSFIGNSDVLDDDRREAFLQTLQELQDVKDQGGYNEEEERQHEMDEEIERQQAEETRIETETEAEHARAAENRPDRPQNTHRRTSSEVDYGIEKTHPNGANAANGVSPNGHTAKPKKVPPETPASAIRRAQFSPPAQTPRSRPGRKAAQAQSNEMFAQAKNLARALRNLAKNLADAIAGNQVVMLRTLLFILAFVMAFSRKAVREQVSRILSESWRKVKGTVGMGVKVSYI